MKIEKEYLEEHRVRLTIEVEAEELEKAKRRAAKNLSKEVKIPGFRPGKAPYNRVVRAVGEEAILNEAIDVLLDDLYPKALEQAEIQPYGPGKVVDVPSLDPPRFVIEVPLEAEVELGDYRAIRLPYEAPTVSEEQLQEALQNLREMSALYEPVERPAQEGDLVYVVISGRRADAAEDDEGGMLFEEQRYPLIIATEEAAQSAQEEGETIPGEPYPGFSRELLGMSAGDEKSVEYTFPEDVEDEDLRGVTVVYTIRVEEVKNRNLPEIDDEFAKSWSEEYETAEEMIDDIRQMLQKKAEEQYNQEYRDRVIDKILEDAVVKFPPEMLEREVEHLLDDLKEDLAARGLNLEQYLQFREMDEDALREEVAEIARSRLRRGLVLNKIAEEEAIEVDPNEPILREQLQEILMQAANSMEPKEFQRLIRDRNWVEGLTLEVFVERTIELTLERLQAIASGQAEAGEAAAEEAGEEMAAEAEPETDTAEEPQEEALADQAPEADSSNA